MTALLNLGNEYTARSRNSPHLSSTPIIPAGDTVDCTQSLTTNWHLLPRSLGITFLTMRVTTLSLSLSLLAALATSAFAAPVPLECQCTASGLSVDLLQRLLEIHGLSDKFRDRPRRTTSQDHPYPTKISDHREPLPTTVLMASSAPTLPSLSRNPQPAWSSRTGDEELSEADENAMERCWRSIVESQQARHKWDDMMILCVIVLFLVAVVLVELAERVCKL
jgi:hypothetical protein